VEKLPTHAMLFGDDPWEKAAEAVNDRVKSIGAIVRRTA
jgi:hypothetical protein